MLLLIVVKGTDILVKLEIVIQKNARETHRGHCAERKKLLF